jgi:hypothetical protein
MPSRNEYYPRQNNPPFGPAEMSMNPQLGQQPYGAEFYGANGFYGAEDPDAYPTERYQRPYPNMSNYDSNVNSPPNSHFGSPTNESPFAKSPMENVRTALNVPMPQSFDPNEPSRKYGILGQSAPVKGPALFSPPNATTSFARRLGSPPETSLNRGFSGNNAPSPLGLSPQAPDESIDRVMQATLSPSQPRGIISASMPRQPQAARNNAQSDLDDNADLGHELLPGSLHDEVLTPAEQMRRLSRADQDSLGVAIPSGHSSKVGSPPSGSSPSRFSHIWAEQRDKQPNLGAVGSPLKESWMPGSSHPPRAQQISGISQAMARMELTRTESAESNAGRPVNSTMRIPSNSMQRLDRTISSPGLPARRLGDESDGEGVIFSMDDDKRPTSIWSNASPRLAPLREGNANFGRVRKDDSNATHSGASAFYGFRP